MTHFTWTTFFISASDTSFLDCGHFWIFFDILTQSNFLGISGDGVELADFWDCKIKNNKSYLSTNAKRDCGTHWSWCHIIHHSVLLSIVTASNIAELFPTPCMFSRYRSCKCDGCWCVGLIFSKFSPQSLKRFKWIIERWTCDEVLLTKFRVAVTCLWVRWVAGAGMCFWREKQNRERYGNYAEKQTLLIHISTCFEIRIWESATKK